MRIAIITDTHWSARKSSKIFQDYFEKFYRNVFFPKLEELGIETIIHMGDAFDSRKSIDFAGLEWTRRVVLDPISKYDVHLITGNHDSYYKNTNDINSPQLLLKDYPNIKVYSSPTEVKIDNLNILMLPWICNENQEKSLKIIKNTNSKVVCGHLELKGFRVNRNLVMDHGLDSDIFNKFKRVFSGHYHTRSNNGKVFYLGNPYEIYWNDVNDDRGFTIFDTETLEHTYINNPHKMFHSIYYEDSSIDELDTISLKNKIVKIIVRKKSDQSKFEKFVDHLYNVNLHELKIVENFQVQDTETFEAFESEDTMSILDRYIKESEIEMDKTIIQKIITDVYREACEVV